MRSRLLSACTTVVAERGYEDASIGQIIATAQLGLADFHGQFADRDACILATHDDLLDRLFATLQAACCGEVDWAESIRVAIAAGLDFFVDLDGASSAFLVQTLSGGPLLVDRRLALAERLTEPLRQGRRCYRRAAALPEATEEFLVAGVVGLVSAHLLAEDLAALAFLKRDVAQFVLAPYMGLAEARRFAAG